MKNKLILIVVILLNLNAQSQFKCDDILYNKDTLVIISSYTGDSLAIEDDHLFTGYCDDIDKKGRILSKSYISFGVLDSIVYYDKNGIIEAVEPYRKWIITGTLKSYYKSGAIKQTINFKNDKHVGLWREYYENEKIKYEADYIDDTTTRDNSYYTWTRKGTKYLHTIQEIYKEKKNGKMLSQFYRTKHSKVKVKTLL